MRLFHLFAVFIVVLTSFAGCDKPGSTGEPAQSKRRGDLTRELAAEILNEYLSNPSVSQLDFQKGGVDRAIADGILVKEN